MILVVILYLYMQLATQNVAAKETEKLSEQLAQIENDIRTKEQQFLVSIDIIINKLYYYKQIGKFMLKVLFSIHNRKQHGEI